MEFLDPCNKQGFITVQSIILMNCRIHLYLTLVLPFLGWVSEADSTHVRLILCPEEVESTRLVDLEGVPS